MLGIVLAVALVGVMPGAIYADANDFTITAFQADYYLTRQPNGRSSMRIVEKIVAEFPDYDQNHGILRAIPKSYDGHRVSPRIIQVMQGSQPASYHSEEDGQDNIVLRIGDGSRYVHGTQTYHIEYKVSDVTKRFAHHDELYWDVNGTGWGQQFNQVTARLHIPNSLASRLNDDAACYEGTEGAPSPCTVSQSADSRVFTFSATRQLYAGENITFAVGFERATFAPYQKTFWEKWLPILMIIWFAGGAIVLLLTIIYMIGAWRQFGKAPKGKGTLIAEYLPPKDLSVLGASAIASKPGPAMTAQIIDLCVRHYIKIYETGPSKKWWAIAKKHSYELELVRDPSGLRNEERQVIDMLFGAKALIGTRVKMDDLKTQLLSQTPRITKDVAKSLDAADYYRNPLAQKKRFYLGGGLTTAAGTLLFNPGVLLAGLVVLITAAAMRPLTVKGVAMRDYLKGLELYMKLAEADRLRLLQSPEGASRAGTVDITNKKQLVKLYERLLPYAILFGLEKEWGRQFAALSTDTPEWYVGSSHFNAAVFASSLQGFTTSATAAFAPATSSGSSGSSGGGSSGGGGGGGGGGGW
jgi:uncharacterized membrane protein YgcG